MLLLFGSLVLAATLLTDVTGQLDLKAGRDEAQEISVAVSSTSPFALSVLYGQQIIQNTAILAGNTNNSVTSVSASKHGKIADDGGQISFSTTNRQVVRVVVNTSSDFVGARFSAPESANFYGVWEYPWDGQQLANTGVDFELKGVGGSHGVNWDNARAPFFFTDAGYGVYTDTLDMGSYNFKQPGAAEFIFNSSTLVYYIIVPKERNDFKSIMTAYAELGNTIYMPPDSAYGPNFWSDDFEQDFHHGVHNAQENYYDVINHLYDYQIHATSMFADRPYGSGNYSWGNFDFNSTAYPTPEKFIANLSHWGFDFQVWAANRAFLDTELFNVSKAHGWLFPGINPEFFLGPALNLSIPEAYHFFKKRLSYFPSVGVKGYKIDRGEEGEMPVYEQNIQAALFDQICYETMAEKWGEGNFYDFARNAVDRSRSKTAIWNGDSHSNYTGLSYSIASGIRAGLLGFSQWGSDTGGYVRELNDPSQELWSRWMWFSAFSPVYEIMVGTNHTPWYPTETNPYTPDLITVLKETTDLHYDLIPYIKSYTYRAHKTGIPVMRAAFLEMPDDSKTYTMAHEYFFGSELFIAPIANIEGRRSVYFPDGTKYLEYFNKTTIQVGGSRADVELDVHSVPAYVRAGAIVPRGQIYRGNDRWSQDWQPELRIELYPSSDVPLSIFSYYNGEAMTEVDITMTMDASSCDVELTYGAVGINGTVELYANSGMKSVSLHASGGSATFSNVASLFDG